MKLYGILVSLVVLTVAGTAIAGDTTKGKTTYDKVCSQCHGPEGLGDGPIGKTLPPASKPASLQTGTFKYATDDQKMVDLIKKGGAGVGLNPLMPPQPTLSEDDIKNVIAYVHTLKK